MQGANQNQGQGHDQDLLILGEIERRSQIGRDVIEAQIGAEADPEAKRKDLKDANMREEREAGVDQETVPEGLRSWRLERSTTELSPKFTIMVA